MLIPEGVTAIGNSAFASTNIADITLPTSLERIGSSAFSNTKLSSVIVPDNVKTIGSDAFRNTPLELVVLPREMTDLGRNVFVGTKLSILEIPEGITSIDDSLYVDNEQLKRVYLPKSLTSFSRQRDWLITEEKPEEKIEYYVYIDSYALEYMVENQVPFKLRDENVSSDESKLLDAGNSFYLATSSSSRREGYLGLDLKYSLKEGKASDDGTYRLRLNIPTTTILYNSTVRLDGQDIPVTLENGYINLPVTARDGRLKLTLKANNNDLTNVQLFAQLAYEKDGRKTAETIGAVNVVVPVLQVTANAVTSRPYARITGIADPADSLVAYLDGVEVGSIKVKKDGTYQLDVPFTTLENNKEYLIRVEATSPDGQGLTASTTVRYEEGLPELENFIMRHNGYEYNLKEHGDKAPVISFRPSGQFEFEVEYSNHEQIDSVYVISEREGLDKRIRLLFDEKTGKFKFLGYFDLNNISYVPGKMTVVYLEKHLIDNFDMVPRVEDIVVNTAIRTDNSLLLNLSDTKSPNRKINIHYVANTAHTPTENEDAHKDNSAVFTFSTVVGDVSYQYQNGELIEKFKSKDGTTTNFTDAFLQFYQDNKEKIDDSMSISSLITSTAKIAINGNFGSLNIDDSGNLLKWYTIPNGIVKTFSHVPEFFEFLGNEFLTCPNITSTDRRHYLEAQRLAQFWGFVNFGYSALATTADIVTIKLEIPWVGPVSNVLDLVVGKWLDKTKQNAYDNARQNVALLKKGCGIPIPPQKYAIDPSGVITNADSNLPVRGATTTVYYRGEDGEEVLWDAGEYSQLNPLSTTVNGEYAWDVPEGYWKVKVEKEGYESAESEWLPVPPPQTEVHFKLKPHAYTIAYNAGEGSMPTTGLVTTYKTDVAVALPQPTRKGYKFAGWFEDSSLTGITYLDTLFLRPGDKTLFAKWEQATKLLGSKDETVFVTLNGEDVDRVRELVKSEEINANLLQSLSQEDYYAVELRLVDENGLLVKPMGDVKFELQLAEGKRPARVLYYNATNQSFEDAQFEWEEDFSEVHFSIQEGTTFVFIYQSTTPSKELKTLEEERSLLTEQVEYIEVPHLPKSYIYEVPSVAGKVVVEITETYVNGMLESRNERELSRTEAIPRKVYQGSRVDSHPQTAPTTDPLPYLVLRRNSRLLTTDTVLYLEDLSLPVGHTREEAGVSGVLVVEIAETILDGKVIRTEEHILHRTEAIPRKVYQGSRVDSHPQTAPTTDPLPYLVLRRDSRPLTTDTVLYLEDPSLPVGRTREEAGISGVLVVEIAETILDGKVICTEEHILHRMEAIPRKVYQGTKLISSPDIEETATTVSTINKPAIQQEVDSMGSRENRASDERYLPNTGATPSTIQLALGLSLLVSSVSVFKSKKKHNIISE